MRVNEVITRCRTDQSIIIHYDERSIVGTVYDIIDIEEYTLNRVSDMIVTNIGTFKSALLLKVVRA